MLALIQQSLSSLAEISGWTDKTISEGTDVGVVAELLSELTLQEAEMQPRREQDNVEDDEVPDSDDAEVNGGGAAAVAGNASQANDAVEEGSDADDLDAIVHPSFNVNAIIANGCCHGNCLQQYEVGELEDLCRQGRSLSGERRRLHLYALYSGFLSIDVPRKKRRGDDGGGAPAEADWKTRPRNSYEITFFGKIICVKALCAIFGVSIRTIARIQAGLADGIIIPVDSLRGTKTGHHFVRTAMAVEFILNFGNIHGHPDPTGRGSRQNEPVIYLPVHMTKADIYKQCYAPEMTALNDENRKALGYKSFVAVWSEKAPIIRIRKPRTDMCDTCARLRVCGTEFELQTHLYTAQIQRTAFQDWVLQSRYLRIVPPLWF